jgi:O-antigen/teichoic acid export membrane protein
MPKPRARKLLIASVAGIAQRLVQMLSSLITLPLALQALGVAGFGVWGAATSLLWLAGMLSFGLGSALVSLLPRGLAAGDTQANRAHVTAALLGGAVLAVMLLLGGAGVIMGGVMHPSAPFLVAAGALIVNIPLSIGAEMWFALQKGHVAAFWSLVQTLLALAGLVVGVALGAEVTALVAVFYGALLLANGGCLAHVLLANHALRPLRRVPLPALRAVLAESGLLSAVTLAAAGSTLFDNVMALAWLGPGPSAQMAVAMRACITATAMVGVVTQPFWPGFADALASHDHGWVRRALFRGMALVATLSLGGSALLVAFGQPVLRFWLHQDLHFTHGLLLAMAGWITLLTFTNVPGALLNASSRLKPQVVVLGLVALVGFGLKYLAARQFGVVGILAVSPALWLVVVVPTYLVLVAKVLR